MKILHVIERLSRGGAGRSLVATAKYLSPAPAVEQAVLSLRPPETAALALAEEAGVPVIGADRVDEVGDLLRRADVVHVHFWNTPELYAWLRTPMPAARVVLTQHVAGEYPAQVMTRAVRDYADHVVLASPYSLRLPVFTELPPADRAERISVVLAGPDFARLEGVGPRAHTGFHVGYVGTVSFTKMHPRFVAMSAAAWRQGMRFVICGGGDGRRRMERQASDLGVGDRFEWHDYTENLGAVLEGLDVFGYPLRRDTYAASELVLQEAMFVGVPPVLLADCAPSVLIEHGETGLLARDEEDYAASLERLRSDPALRARLSSQARIWARAHAGASVSAPALNTVYENVLALPKRERTLAPAPRLSPHEGANAFIESLGATAAELRVSLLAPEGDEQRRADAAISDLSPVATDPAAGGVLHYRRFYPADPYLALWSGLVLLGQGRPALAAAELQRAGALGLAGRRSQDYLSDAVARAR
jgi:glycosyltransferase involved in cell wall biosynthesis